MISSFRIIIICALMGALAAGHTIRAEEGTLSGEKPALPAAVTDEPSGEETPALPSMLAGRPGSEMPSIGGMLLRTFGALGLIVLLMVGLVFVLRRFVFQHRVNGVGNNAIAVLSSTFLAPKKSIHLIQVLNRVLVVGVTDAGISILSEFQENEIGKEDVFKQKEINRPPLEKAFQSLLGKLKR